MMNLESTPALLTDRPDGPTALCLLIVDDERSLLRAFALCFKKAGYEVLEAGDVTQALAIWTAQRERIVLILSDVQMPGPPVEDLIARARSDAPAVPILLMSGEMRGPQTRIDSLMESVNGFLAKPLRLDALRLEVARHLQLRLSS